MVSSIIAMQLIGPLFLFLSANLMSIADSIKAGVYIQNV